MSHGRPWQILDFLCTLARVSEAPDRVALPVLCMRLGGGDIRNLPLLMHSLVTVNHSQLDQ